MNRKEEIKRAASDHYFRMSQGVDYHLAPEREAGFIQGALWAFQRASDLHADIQTQEWKDGHYVKEKDPMGVVIAYRDKIQEFIK